MRVRRSPSSLFIHKWQRNVHGPHCHRMCLLHIVYSPWHCKNDPSFFINERIIQDKYYRSRKETKSGVVCLESQSTPRDRWICLAVEQNSYKLSLCRCVAQTSIGEQGALEYHYYNNGWERLVSSWYIRYASWNLMFAMPEHPSTMLKLGPTCKPFKPASLAANTVRKKWP